MCTTAGHERGTGHRRGTGEPGIGHRRGTDGRGPDGAAAPASADEAVAMALAGLRWLAAADMASVPTSVQADCLRGLERVLSVHTVARAAVLGAFTAQAGYEDDGHGSPRTWMTWQTRITRQAATAALAALRRLTAHPGIADALRDGALSASWARQIADWTDLLPAEHRCEADAILLTAAASGADLADLARLAGEMRARLARPDRDGHGFDDRSVRLATTLGGAGKLYGDLTPRCAAAVQAVLDALGKRAGPEDTRTLDQRHHDALDEAARRLIASGCLPDRAGQPTQIQLHMTLDELTRRLANAAAAPDQPAAPAQGDPADTSPAWPGTAPAAPGDECDAAIVPVVTGTVDHDLLDRLTGRLSAPGLNRPAARDLILTSAIALLSGPHGLAAWLRSGTLTGPAASISLPLDIGTTTETIPPHLRRAVIHRDRHCAAPGCDQPPAACQVHHLTPRSQGGGTKLGNLILLCAFHHLILIHQWGWAITLNPDGTTTMANADRTRVWHSHGPPATAA